MDFIYTHKPLKYWDIENHGVIGSDPIRLPDPTVIKPGMPLKEVYKIMGIPWREPD